MTPGDREALDALALRLRHVAATAAMLARAAEDDRDGCDALAGVAATLDDLSVQAANMASRA